MSAAVSVVVCAYNQPELLRVALDSIREQTLTDLEIIVNDDSSDSRCAEVVMSLADDRIRYTRHSPGWGTVANHRAGYRSATGRFLTTLNHDDVMTSPRYLETMVAALESHPECALAFSDHDLIDEAGRVDAVATERMRRTYHRDRLTPGVVQDPLRVALVDKTVPGMFAVYRAAALDLDDFPDDVSSGYDFWLVYLAVRDGGQIYFEPESLTSYRVHPDSQTSAHFRDVSERYRFDAYTQYIEGRMIADPRLASVAAPLRRRLADGLARSSGLALRAGRPSDARASAIASLKASPTWRGAGGLALSFLPSSVSRQLVKRGR